jgi:hypothetical protein
MSKENMSPALAASNEAIQQKYRTFTAMFFAVAFVAIALYANTFLSLSPEELLTANVLGAVSGVALIFMGVTNFRRSLKVLSGK